MKGRTFVAVTVIGVLVLLVATALARPGGGESFSGGGGHGGGGGGGGGGIGDIFELIELVIWLIQLFIEYPKVMLTLTAIGIAAVVWSAHKQRVNKDWDSGPPVAVQPSFDLEAVRKLDSEFSQVVFEDFAFRLFSAAHRARSGKDQLAVVAPYVSVSARAQLAERDAAGGPAVQQVIVGALRVIGADIPTPEALQQANAKLRIEVEFEANIATGDKTSYTVERWRFARDASRRSKPPGSYTTFPCPNCGAPWQSTDTATQTCSSCGQVVDNGRFDWVVEDVRLLSQQDHGPTLTTEVPERGTDLPTYKQRDANERFQRLTKKDPAVDLPSINGRIELIFHALGPAWSRNDLRAVRGLVSDGLYDYLDYWVSAYRQQGLRNQMEDTKITRSELAKVVNDRWYDAVTIRIWATGIDYVINEKTGQIVRGSKRRPRPYSEYWTLIRSGSRKGPSVTKAACPNCGAPLDVTMAGACTHCGVHVSGGEFDWVLSKIEQDDTYRG